MDRQGAGRLLDLTRLVSRAGRVLTGVDRVELAYADRFVEEPAPLWGLVRTAYGFLLLDKSAVGEITNATRLGSWGRPDLLSRLKRGLGQKRQAGQSFARRHAIARARPSGLGRMLRSNLPKGITYFNLGHSNLEASVLEGVRSVPDCRIVCMIHDTIPLDFPEFQREGTVEEFRAKLGRVGAMADAILCPSDASATDIRRHLGEAAPPITSAHLGVVVDEREAPPTSRAISNQTYFAVLGTIEPRKNHALLLDIWEEIGPAGPGLVIIGKRGWKNEAVFARLDRGVPGVQELGAVSDIEARALLRRSLGLLFPSYAEGYGLPPIEAAALGVPVIASDLPVLRETLGGSAVYLNANDRYQWKKTIEALAAEPGTTQRTGPEFIPPSWDDHFKVALSVI